MNELHLELVNWSRAQFALTAIYHWLFVPLTLGLSFIVAIMESIYVKTGNEEWKRITKFWMKLFGINFAIGVATGIILEFEFGTNWSNYSWIVGDIFGAPLAVEGIMAFFLESTFIAVMFFGWGKVSKKFHLTSTWLVAIGSNLSALWILVANAWMQEPVGMIFNPNNARHEMLDFWEVLLSPMAVSKFLHTVSSGYITGALFVASISAWFILKGRQIAIARKSLIIAIIFGLTSSLLIGMNGDSSAKAVADAQPMKLAAMEGLYDGQKKADLIMIGMLTPDKKPCDSADAFVFKIAMPGMLSMLAGRSADEFLPGINDLVNGNSAYNIISTEEKMERGRAAVNALARYKSALQVNDTVTAADQLIKFRLNAKHFGYGYLTHKTDVVPNVPITFYSFHIMVVLGFYFIALFALLLYFVYKDKLITNKLLLRVTLWSLPLGWIASELGWIVTEVGRQPWTIQDLLPTSISTSHISAASVQTTFWIFACLFTLLLIAEVRIMIHQIKLGPEEKGE